MMRFPSPQASANSVHGAIGKMNLRNASSDPKGAHYVVLRVMRDVMSDLSPFYRDLTPVSVMGRCKYIADYGMLDLI